MNPKLKEVGRGEVLILLDEGNIFLISDRSWVVQYMWYLKYGIIVERNENNELIPASLLTGWRVYIDYRKVNNVTRKDHFLLPFIDQMLERSTGHFHHYFDWYSGYNQIWIALEIHEKNDIYMSVWYFCLQENAF